MVTMNNVKHINELAKIDSSSLIVQSNDFIYGVFDFSLDEYRIIIYLQSLIHLHDVDFKKHEVKIQDIAEKAGLSSGNHLYEKIEKVSKILMSKIVTVRDGKSFKMKHLMDTVEYDDGRGVLSLCFHDDMKPYFLGLTGNFTKEQEENLWRFKNTKPINLFLLLKPHAWVKDKRPARFAVTELRRLMNLEEQYKNFSMFRERVIVFSQKRIEESSDIFFDFLEESNGKTKAITDVEFYIHFQHPIWKFSYDVIQIDDVIDFATVAELAEYLEVFAFEESKISEITKKFDLSYLLEKVNYIRYRTHGLTDLSLCGNYFLRALENDYSLPNVKFILTQATSIEEEEKHIDELFEKLISYEINKKTANKFIKAYSPEYIRSKIDYLEKEMKTRNITNIAGFLRKAIENDYVDSKSSMKVANEKANKKSKEKAAQDKAERDRKQKEDAERSTKAIGYFDTLLSEVVRSVDDKERDTFLEELVEANKDASFIGLVKKGKTSFEDVMGSPITKAYTLDKMAKKFLPEEFHSLDAWTEHQNLSKDSSTLSA